MPLDDPITESVEPEIRLAVALERLATATRDTSGRVEGLHGLLTPLAAGQIRWNTARSELAASVAGFVGIPRLILGQNRIAQLVVVGVAAIVVLVWVGVDSELATRAVLDKLGLYIPPPPVECSPVTVETTTPLEVIPIPIPIPSPSEVAPLPVPVLP